MKTVLLALFLFPSSLPIALAKTPSCDPQCKGAVCRCVDCKDSAVGPCVERGERHVKANGRCPHQKVGTAREASGARVTTISCDEAGSRIPASQRFAPRP